MAKVLTKTQCFALFWTQQFRTPHVASRYLASPIHPMRPKIEHMYENRARDCLWLSFSIAQVASLKPVVRSWSKRRTRAAFTQALKDHGYNHEGKKIKSDPDGQQSVSEKGGLRGSVVITTQPIHIKMDYASLRKDMGKLVDEWMSKMKATSPVRKTFRFDGPPKKGAYFNKGDTVKKGNHFKSRPRE